MALRKMNNPQIDLKSDTDNIRDNINFSDKSKHRTEFEDRVKRIEEQNGDNTPENTMEKGMLGNRQQTTDNRQQTTDNRQQSDLGEEKQEQDVQEQISALEKRLEVLKGKTREKKEKAEKIIRRKEKAEMPEEKRSQDSFVEGKKENKIIETEKPKQALKFPDGFLWGTSTSAYQVEGGIMNDWSQWEKSGKRMLKLMKQGKNPNHFICGQACDSYNRYKEDLELAASLNNNAIRFGLEWSRIQPKKDTWDVGAINHYRDVLAEAKKRGLKTVVTLWHWTNPAWVAKEKGWVNNNNIKHYLRYVDLVIKELGADIDYWVTLNEPMVHVVNGYINGKFPPEKRNIFKAKSVFDNLAKAHIEAYKKIHNYFPKAQVSITKLTNYFEPARKWCPAEIGLAKLLNYLANTKFLNKITNHLDYIGLDYYFYDRIVWYPPFKKNKNKRVTDMGWEIYPEGIYHVLKYLAKFNKPILILENGLADTEDKYRADFIREHLYYMHQAIEGGVDVQGYFYWSLLDNFEWADGYGPKFGLYEVDRKTFERTPRSSAKVYAKICTNNAVEIEL